MVHNGAQVKHILVLLHVLFLFCFFSKSIDRNNRKQTNNLTQKATHGHRNHGGRGGLSPPPQKKLSLSLEVNTCFNSLQCYTCLNQ